MNSSISKLEEDLAAFQEEPKQPQKPNMPELA